jgi:hypothetical protein
VCEPLRVLALESRSCFQRTGTAGHIEAVDAELRRLPSGLIEAIWAGWMRWRLGQAAGLPQAFRWIAERPRHIHELQKAKGLFQPAVLQLVWGKEVEVRL